MVLEGLDDLYRDTILKHSRHPLTHEPPPDPDIMADGVNVFCGDEVHLQILLDDNGRVARVGLQVEGCSINRAAGSMLSAAINGRSLEEIDVLAEAFNEMMRDGEASVQDRVDFNELRALSGLRAFPVRVKCALLSWSALRDGIREHRGS